jgi:hypothetical protein
MTCHKKPFTHLEALYALEEVNFYHKRGDGKNRRECRCYECPECGKWHLTSQKEGSVI